MESWYYFLCSLPWCHLIVSFDAYKSFILIKSNFPIFSFVVSAFDFFFFLRNHCQIQGQVGGSDARNRDLRDEIMVIIQARSSAGLDKV